MRIKNNLTRTVSWHFKSVSCFWMSHFLPLCIISRLLLSRTFSLQRCARCHLGIPAKEIVMRARDLVYHLSCFSCVTCDKVLLTGDHYGLRDTSVYCQIHFESMLQEEQHANSQTSTHEGAPVQRGRSRRRKNLDAADHVVYNSGNALCIVLR